MADCSKTLEFFNERERLCNSYKCKMCPVQLIFKIPDVCPLFDDVLIDEKLIDYLQRWSDEHPAPKQKTYADVFFERFPNNTILTRFPKNFLWMNSLCRDVYFGGVDCRPGRDCKSCWEEPYQEQDGKGVIDNG